MPTELTQMACSARDEKSYGFLSRPSRSYANHIDIIEVWMLVLRHTEPVADHFLNHHPVATRIAHSSLPRRFERVAFDNELFAEP